MSLNITYSVHEGIRGLNRAKFATWVTVSTIGICMLLLGFFLVFTVNLQQIVNRVREKVSIEVFADSGLNETALLSIQTGIASIKGVSNVHYVSPDEALKRFEKEFGEDPLDILGDNPLPGSFEIQLAPEIRKPDAIDAIARNIELLSHVDEVIYHSTLIQTIDRYSRIILIVDGVLFVVILMASILLISNTLRLIIYAQREIIDIMNLVGATPAFIRRPYLIQGLIQGGVGGLISCVLLWIIGRLVAIAFPTILQIELYYYGILLLFSLFIGYLGSWFGLHRFLKV